MTLGDVMALSIGVALGMAFETRSGGGFGLIVPPGWVLAVLGILALLWVACLALSAVVLARLVRFRRQARPAEWLAILVAVARLADGSDFGVDYWVNEVLQKILLGAPLFSALRWGIAGVGLAIIGVTLAILRTGRRRLAPWLMTTGLAWAAFVALWGPIPVLGLEGPDLMAPSEGFGPGDFSTLHRAACLLLAQVPVGLMFGVPVIAAFAERVRRLPWAWTEWASVVASGLAGTFLAMLHRFEFARPSLAWVVERGLVALWFLGVGLLSGALVRWLAQAPGARSSEASPARIR